MKKSIIKAGLAIIAVSFTMALVSMPMAAGPIQYNCSSKIYETFTKSEMEVFTKATGIPVNIVLSSCHSCVYRVMKGMTDIGSTTQGIYKHHKKQGIIEIPFCKNPLAIIVNKDLDVGKVTRIELKEIFSGSITNWKKLGGPDLPITLVVPNRDSCVYKDFRRKVMHNKDVPYDYSVQKSTRVFEAIEALPTGAVSFISRGAQIRQQNIKVLSVEGKKPSDREYPLYQTFYLVTKGQPRGATKIFVDFIQSDSGQSMIRGKGMLPIGKTDI